MRWGGWVLPGRCIGGSYTMTLGSAAKHVISACEFQLAHVFDTAQIRSALESLRADEVLPEAVLQVQLLWPWCCSVVIGDLLITLHPSLSCLTYAFRMSASWLIPCSCAHVPAVSACVAWG